MAVDLSQYSDEELVQMRGSARKLKPSNDLSKVSDEELLSMQATYKDGNDPRVFSRRVAERQKGRQTPASAAVSEIARPRGVIEQTLQTAAGAINPALSPAIRNVATPLMVGAERAVESALTAPFIELARGRPERALPELGKAAIGKSRAEFGDMIYGKTGNESLAKVGGSVMGVALPGVMGIGRTVGTDIASDASKAVEKTTGAVKDVASRAVSDLTGKEYIPANLGQRGEQAVVKIQSAVNDVQRSIRPSVQGRALTTNEVTQYNRDINFVAKDIVKNKNTIKFTDEAGQVIAQNRAPDSLFEASQAQSQRLSSLYQKWHTMTKAAKDNAGMIELNDVTGQLMHYADAVEDLAGTGVRSLAIKTMKKLEQYGQLDPLQSERLLKRVTRNMGRAYVKNPAKYDFYKAYHDALLKAHDDALDRAGQLSAEYNALRQDYRAHKNIQRDINHRMWIDARKAYAQMPDMFEMFSAGDFVQGVARGLGGDVTGAAGLFGRTAGMRIAKDIMKKLNSPDRAIKNLFKTVEEVGDRVIVTGEVVQPRSGKALPPPDPARRIPTADEVKRDTQNYFRNQAAEKSDIPVRPTPEQAYSMRNRELPAPDQIKALPFQRQDKRSIDFTRGEVVESLGRHKSNPEFKRQAILAHKRDIKQTIVSGGDVSDNVLKGYPDYEKKYGQMLKNRRGSNKQAQGMVRESWDRTPDAKPDVEVPNFIKSRTEIKNELGPKATNEQKRSAVLKHKNEVRRRMKAGEDIPERAVKEYDDLYKEWKKLNK